MLSFKERVGVTTDSLNSYSTLFRKVFPYYLSIGMTSEEFWDGDSDLVIYYRKAEELRLKKANQQSWLQGRYMLDALVASPMSGAFMKKGTRIPQYPSKPYDLDFDNHRVESIEDMKYKKQQSKGMEHMKTWATSVNSYFKK